MAESPPDAVLMASAAGGDRAAFETIARRYQQRLMRYAGRSLRTADAQDVVQDALVKAFIHIDHYNARWSAATWLFMLTRRATVDRLRSIRREKEFDRPTTETAVSPAIEAERHDLHGRLWTIAAERLPGEQVQAIWLHYVENLGTRDIARVMGRSWVWVKQALHRGRKTLAPHVAHLSDAASDDGISRVKVNGMKVVA